MGNHISTGAVHHFVLTVTDTGRSRKFYTSLLGFEQVGEFGPRALLSNGSMILAVGPAPDPSRAISNDRFNENRVGLDHVSFSVGSLEELEAAARLFDENDVPHGEVTDLGPDVGLYILAFRDPDNIQVELTTPRG